MPRPARRRGGEIYGPRWKEPETAAKDVRELLRSIARPGHLEPAFLKGVWRRVVGPDLADQTRLLGFRQGVLTVGVASSALLWELQQFRAKQIHAALVAELPAGKLLRVRYVPHGTSGRAERPK